MAEFTLNGQQYSAGKMDAFKQLHVSRKIGPIIPPLIPVFLKLSKSSVPLTENLAAIGELLGPFADGLASMPDETAEYVMGTCLSVVQRKQGNDWAPVWSERGRTCMFDDMGLDVLIPIVVRVIQSNLGNFINGLLTSQTGVATA